MRELKLSAQTQAIFDRIKSYAWTLNVYGLSSSRAEWLVKARTRARIHKAGVVPPYTNVYRRYVSELIRVFRSETGERLIAGIKLTMRKWVNFGLDQALLEGLLSDCFLRFEQQGYAMPKAKKLGKPAKPPRRRRTSYEDALKRGRATLRAGSTVKEQVSLQEQGAALASAIARALKPVLAERGITGRGMIPYFNFAQQLGRLSRKFGDKSLQMAAADVIDYHDAKSLDRDALRAIAATLFGVDVSS
jgi:hypothetical protein